MAEYDYVDKSTGADYYGEGVPSMGVGAPTGFFVWKRHVDLATAGDTFITSDGKFESGDTLNLFNVVEGMLIQGVAVEVTTEEGATLDADVGDGDDPDGFIDGVNLNSAGWYISYDSGDETAPGDYCDGTTYHGGRFYTSADTIDMTFNSADADTAVFDIYVWGIDLRPIA